MLRLAFLSIIINNTFLQLGSGSTQQMDAKPNPGDVPQLLFQYFVFLRIWEPACIYVDE